MADLRANNPAGIVPSVAPRVIMVTGASRGIGRAIALALAAQGHSLILTARSVDGGAKFSGTSMNDPLTGIELTGSVADVAQACQALGSRAIAVPMDLTVESSVLEAAETALSEFGVVDTLVSNAIYQGPGVNDWLQDLPIENLRRVIEGDAIAPMIMLKKFLPGMLTSERGVFIHLTSGAASLVPKKPAGKGGWGVAYAMAKGAAHRIAGVMHAEYSPQGLRAYSLNPGHVTTEVMALRAQREGREVTGNGPEDVAVTAQWLIDGSSEAVELSGQEVVSRDVIQRLRSS
jgi:NAD(P)-dependent dehydrogenase (short-subunit alcohol dehydrogenase family)